MHVAQLVDLRLELGDRLLEVEEGLLHAAWRRCADAAGIIAHARARRHRRGRAGRAGVRRSVRERVPDELRAGGEQQRVARRGRTPPRRSAGAARRRARCRAARAARTSATRSRLPALSWPRNPYGHELHVVDDEEEHDRGADERRLVEPLRQHVDGERRSAGVRERAGEAGHRTPECAGRAGPAVAPAARRAARRSVKPNQRLSANVTAIRPISSRIASTGSAPNASAPRPMPTIAPGSSAARCSRDQRPR